MVCTEIYYDTIALLSSRLTLESLPGQNECRSSLPANKRSDNSDLGMSIPKL